MFAVRDIIGSRGPRFNVCYYALLLVLSLILSAFLLGVGIGQPVHSWFAWGGLAPLLLAVRFFSPLRAAVAGAIWGLSVLLSSLVVPGNGAVIPYTVSSLVCLAILPAAYAFVAAAVSRHIGFKPLLLALSWLGVELAFPRLGLPNGLLAATQGDSTAAHLVGNIFGYGFIAFLIVFTNALFVTVLCAVARARPIKLAFAFFTHQICFVAPPQGIVPWGRYLLQPSHARAPPLLAAKLN